MHHVEAGPHNVLAYIGPHVANCCYNVDERRISLFRNRFDTIAAVGHELDLSAAVIESLGEAGIARQAIAETGLCTSDHTERFYSFRAAQVTGRHGAIAAIA
jgi:copper oxidase (laccase) domain-containing protein